MQLLQVMYYKTCERLPCTMFIMIRLMQWLLLQSVVFVYVDTEKTKVKVEYISICISVVMRSLGEYCDSFIYMSCK